MYDLVWRLSVRGANREPTRRSGNITVKIIKRNRRGIPFDSNGGASNGRVEYMQAKQKNSQDRTVGEAGPPRARGPPPHLSVTDKVIRSTLSGGVDSARLLGLAPLRRRPVGRTFSYTPQARGHTICAHTSTRTCRPRASTPGGPLSTAGLK